jgi:predicted Zn-dependent protease
VFTLSLIYLARNSNELALVMGHEAAHHIAGHYGKSRDNAFAGAVLGSVLAGLAGGDAAAMKTARGRGATHGVQRHAIGFELEADALGTRIAFAAGFDPKIGARIFTRISEPRDQSSATHPRNRLRIQAVRQTLAGLR